MLVQGKKVIVTGGLTGIGKETLFDMAKEGASVVSFSRKKADSKEAMEIISKAKELGNGLFKHIQCDVTNQEEVKKAVDEAVEFLDGLDAVVNSAAIEFTGLPEEVTPDALYTPIYVSLGGTAFVSAAAFPYLKDNGGVVVNFTSVAGIDGKEDMPGYTSAKGAVMSYTRMLASAWGKYNIRSNVINPSVKTELVEEWLENMTPEEREQTIAWIDNSIPLKGGLRGPKEVAYLITFLVSDRASYITGQTINIDGGITYSR